jgi:hypothetical protein
MIILIFASLLALFIPGGTILFILWFRSKSAEKQRELLKKLNKKRKLIVPAYKLGRDQLIYMRSKLSNPSRKKKK